MKSIYFSSQITITAILLLLGFTSTVNCGGLHLDFGLNLPPFVLHMPRFNLPPVRIAATFKPSFGGSQPFAIKFPGISISTNQGHQNSDGWWNQARSWPEPEPEPEHHPEPEPESEPEPETYHHDPWNDAWAKSSANKAYRQEKLFKDPWASGNEKAIKTQHIYMKQQSKQQPLHQQSGLIHQQRQKAIVAAHMEEVRGQQVPMMQSLGDQWSPQQSEHVVSNDYLDNYIPSEYQQFERRQEKATTKPIQTNYRQHKPKSVSSELVYKKETKPEPVKSQPVQPDQRKDEHHDEDEEFPYEDQDTSK